MSLCSFSFSASAADNEAAKVKMAMEMAEYGKHEKDPYAIISAVKAMQSFSGPVSMAKNGEAAEKYDLVALLKLAKSFDADNKQLAAVIDQQFETLSTDKWGNCYWEYRYVGYYYEYYWYCY